MKKFLFLGFCGLFAAGMTGCKDDVLSDGANTLPEMDGETGYLSFKIKSADTGGMTRAWLDADDNFAKGDPAEDTHDNFAGEDQIAPNVQANRAFFFYEVDGKTIYHSSSLLQLEGQESNDHSETHGEGSAYPETFYSTTVKRTSDRGNVSWPTKVLIVLNGRPSRLNALTVECQENPDFDMNAFLAWVNKDLKETDAEGEGITLGLYNYNSKYYFTMSNSVFLNEEGELQNATNINIAEGGDLYMTREEAAANPVTVYVERIMSKVEVGFTGYEGAEEGKPGYITDGANTPLGFLYSFTDSKETDSKWANEWDEQKDGVVKLKALITNWTINAVEYQTSLFKVLDNSWSGTTPFDGWNDFSHHRSYWAKDSHYDWDETKYPTQYRVAFDGTATPYQNNWEYGKATAETGGNDIFSDNYPWALDYKSFSSVTNKRKYKYCLENTFGYNNGALANYKHMIMGSHLLIEALLLTEEEANGIENAKSVDELNVSDKYYFSDSYYDEKAYIGSRVTRLNQFFGENVGNHTVDNMKFWADDDSDKEKFSFDIQGGLWVKGDDGKFKRVVVQVSDDNKDNEIAATDVFCIAPAYVLKGDGKVTVALKETYGSGEWNGKFGYNNKNVNLYYLKENTVGNDGQPTVENNTPVQFSRNELASLIYQVAGWADCFKGGRMYYAVPIQHFIAAGADNNYNYNYGTTDKPLVAGDYGVVRNHWYKFTINKILKPGIPVHDPLQPIIPNYDDTDRYIGLQVVILPWHIVDNGKVTLGENK